MRANARFIIRNQKGDKVEFNLLILCMQVIEMMNRDFYEESGWNKQVFNKRGRGRLRRTRWRLIYDMNYKGLTDRTHIEMIGNVLDPI